MKHENLFPLQEVLGTDLERLQEAKENAIVERNRDYFSEGILKTPGKILNEGVEIDFSGDEFPVSFTNPGPGSHSLDIGKGISYSRVGERIIIPTLLTYNASNPSQTDVEGNATPQSTGSQSITTLSQGDNYVYAEYLATIDTSVFFPDPISGLRHYQKVTDGYQINWSTVPENDPAPTLPVDAIFLAKVTVDVNINITNVDLDGRIFSRVESRKVEITVDTLNPTTVYTDGTTTSLNEHINALGEGTPAPNNPHGMGIADVDGLEAALAAATAEPLVEAYQRESHSNGIYSPDQGNTANNLFPAIFAGSFSGAPVGTLAYVQCKKLDTATQAVYVNGKRTQVVTPTAVSLNNDPFVSFFDADATGTYSIFIEQTGSDFVLTKTLSFAASDTKFLIATVDWNTVSNTLGNLVDFRVFNLTGNANIQDNSIDLSTKLDPNFVLPGVNFDDTSHGLRGSGTNVSPLHSLATTLDPGFLASSDKIKLDSFGTNGELQTDAQHGARSNKTTGGSGPSSPLLHPLGVSDAQPGFSANSFTDALLSKVNGITAGATLTRLAVVYANYRASGTIAVSATYTPSTNSFSGFSPSAATIEAALQLNGTFTSSDNVLAFTATYDQGSAGGANTDMKSYYTTSGLGFVPVATGSGNTTFTMHIDASTSTGNLNIGAIFVFVGIL